MKGEVYDVDDAMLRILDELEGHPDYYTRDKATVKYLTDENGTDVSGAGKTEVVQMYFLKHFREELLSADFAEEFDNNLTQYVARGERPQQADPRAHWWDVKHKP